MCILVVGLAVKDAFCRLQAPHFRFPNTNTNNLYQGDIICHNRDITGSGNFIAGDLIDCSFSRVADSSGLPLRACSILLSKLLPVQSGQLLAL